MKNARLRVLLLILSDLLCLEGTLLFFAWGYWLFGGKYDVELYFRVWPMLFGFVICGAFMRLYHGNVLYPGAPLSPVEEVRRTFLAMSLTYLLLFSYLALTRRVGVYSRFVLGVSWLVSPFLLLAGRNLLRALLKRFGWAQIPVLIAGGGGSGRKLRDVFLSKSYWGFEFKGFLDDREDIPERVGALSDCARIGREWNVPVLVLSLPPTVVLDAMHEGLRHFQYVLMMVEEDRFPTSWAYPINIQGFGGVEVQNKLLQPMPRFLKLSSDCVLAAFGILLLSPLFLILALIVKISSPGPIFYKARRLGLHGKPIEVWKFRSMYRDADSRLQQLLAENPELKREWDCSFKLEKDPRITGIGNFLRKTSLDELPQLCNVLRGEMAMIGPRPIVEEEVALYGTKYEVFRMVKPGISGLWQVSGRSNVDYSQRVALDMYYCSNWSIWLDLYILIMTIPSVLIQRGAK